MTARCSCCSSETSRQRRGRRRYYGSSRMIAFTFCALAIILSAGSAFQPATAYRRRATIATTSGHSSSSFSKTTALQASTAVPPAERSTTSSLLNDFFLPKLEFPNPFQAANKRQRSTKQSSRTSAAVDRWAAKYCTVAGLRESFGSNHNALWGDLDACNTRRLYKSLLPVALLELRDCGVLPPESLAPLAYKARVAAKLYARERCRVPARVAANLFDGYRQWRKYGSFDMTGMSYQQVWEKYAALVEDETADDKDDNMTTKICLKILERSCISNEKIDRMVLNNRKDKAELKHITEQLEQDVKLLLNMNDDATDDAESVKRQAQKFRALRQIAKVKRRIAKFNKQQQR